MGWLSLKQEPKEPADGARVIGERDDIRVVWDIAFLEYFDQDFDDGGQEFKIIVRKVGVDVSAMSMGWNQARPDIGESPPSPALDDGFGSWFACEGGSQRVERVWGSRITIVERDTP